DRPLGGRLPRPGVQLPHGGPRRGRRPGDGGRARALSRRHLRRARGGRARPSVSPRACSATQESHPQSVAPSPLALLTGTVASSQRKRGGTPMHQRQPRHLRSGAALASVLALVGILGLAPRAAHAQGQCATEFQEQTSGTVTDGGTICATAVGNKCTFQLALCVNQSGNSCTLKDLIRASSLCAGGIGKVNVKANGTSSVCGSFVGVRVKTKKHGRKTGSCKIHAKAGQSRST